MRSNEPYSFTNCCGVGFETQSSLKIPDVTNLFMELDDEQAHEISSQPPLE
jgi:hypothetical protein